MGLHLYCIVPPAQAAPPGLAGVDGASVEVVPAAGLAVWVSRHDAPPTPSIDAVRAHNAVVVAAMDREITPVPVRFGQWLAGETAVEERVAAERDRWADRLAVFAGRAEYGATVSAAASEAARDVRAAEAATGTAYMQELARRQAGAAQRRNVADRIAGYIATQVEHYATETRVELPAEGDVIARIAHLVAWADADAYHGVMRELCEPRTDAQLRLSGPWPPYSFA
jgi:hypothetical protein